MVQFKGATVTWLKITDLFTLVYSEHAKHATSSPSSDKSQNHALSQQSDEGDNPATINVNIQVEVATRQTHALRTVTDAYFAY